MAFYNVNRQIFTNFNDTSKAVSTLTAEDHERATAAMRNVHFRRAISFATDRATYNAQTNGEELKLNSLRNCYTPGNFVALAEEVTVQINGTNKTYPAGTYYGKIMQDQLDADGVKIKVWDPQADDGNGSSDGFDGWYNVANAVEEMTLAVDELGKIGI
jgi:ABC-type oligopeptide transport system substrate-binding subunit